VSVNEDLLKALRKGLIDNKDSITDGVVIVLGYPVKFDSIDYEPDAGDPYIATHYLPASSDVVETGNTKRGHEGVYQIDINSPMGEISSMYEKADSIEGFYSAGSTLTFGAVSVVVTNTNASPVRKSGAFGTISISVFYSSQN